MTSLHSWPGVVASRRTLLKVGALGVLGLAGCAQPNRPGTLAASRFGAVGDGIVDDGPALRRAFAALGQAQQGSTLSLEARLYRIDSAGAGDYALELRGARGVSVEGRGARLLITSPTIGGLRLVGAADTSVADLSFDYAPRPYAIGVIERASPTARTLDVRLSADSLAFDDPRFAPSLSSAAAPGFASVFDVAKRRLKAGVRDHFDLTNAVRTGPSTFRLSVFGEHPDGVAVGDVLIYVLRGHKHAVELFRSPRVHLRGLTVRSAPAAAFAIVQSDATQLRACGVRSLDPQDLATTNGDGVHVQDCRVGPTLSQCSFEGMLDDGLNIYARPHPVRLATGRQLIIDEVAGVATGDRLEFHHPETGVVLGTWRVSAARRRAGGLVSVRLAGKRNVWTGPLPPLEGVVAYNLSMAGAGYAVRDCSFSRHRGNAMRLRSGGGLVERNTVREVSNRAILISNEPAWPEGPYATDVVVRQNTIEDVGYSSGEAAVEVTAHRLGPGLAQGHPQQRITLQDNRINDWRGAAVRVSAARDVAIVNTTLALNGTGEGQAQSAVVLRQCRGVRIDGLRITTRQHLAAAVTVERDVEGLTVRGVATSPSLPVVLHTSRGSSGPALRAPEDVGTG